MTFEQSNDGVTYYTLSVLPYNSGTAVTTATAVGLFFAHIYGVHYVRVNFSTPTSGGVVVTIATTSATK